MEIVTNAANWAAAHPKAAISVLIAAFILVTWMF